MFRVILTLAVCAAALFAQTKKIVVNSNDQDLMNELKNASPKVRLVPVTAETAMRELPDADAFIGDIKPEQVRAGKNLKWVQIMSAGCEKVLFMSGSNDLRDSNIVLTNNRIVQGPEIADHALAMLLMLTRGLNTFYAAKSKEMLTARPYPGIELNGRNAVVIGVGGIGSQIALRAWAFGMNVTGVDPEDIPFSPFIKRVVKPDHLDEVIPAADVVFISAPLTEKSRKMMGPRQFELMKKNSYFIAVSRGGIYDLNGLVKALDGRQLAGAGVDVTDPEPLPKGHPLWKFDNVVITPHIAGRSDKDHARMINTVRQNIQRFADGEPLINMVNKQKGY